MTHHLLPAKSISQTLLFSGNEPISKTLKKAEKKKKKIFFESND
jgi:hypothetical protein